MSVWSALSLAGALSAGVVLPSGIEVEKLADSTYQPPGVPGSYFFIEQVFPVICGERVFFAGVTDLASNTTIYGASSAGVEAVADQTVPIPGTGATFTSAGDPACAPDGRLLFHGSGPAPSPGTTTHAGIYAWNAGQIELLQQAPVDFGAMRFRNLGNVVAGAGGFAAGGSTFQLGLGYGSGVLYKSWGGPPQVVADGLTTPVPGHATPPGYVSAQGFWGSDLVVFADSGSYRALYRWAPGRGFSIIVDNATVYPEVGSTLLTFGDTVELAAGLVFAAAFPGSPGGSRGLLLARGDGLIVPFVVPGDPTADGETLLYAELPSGAGSLLTFRGRTVGSQPFSDAIFVRTPDGLIRRVLRPGDPIDGVLAANLLSRADDRYLAINAELAQPPGNRTIYRAAFSTGVPVDVPAASPAGRAGLAAGLALAALVLLRLQSR